VRQGHLNQIDSLFTDVAPPASMAETIAAAGTQVFVAE
jgi:DeoR family glycerol-3-phosphate regulon repressor